MKIRVLSDLHLEFGSFSYEPRGEDVLVLAGDIGIHIDGMIWARAMATVPTVMIAGNHEYYRGLSNTMGETLAALRARSDDRVTFLEEGVTVIDDVRFICATLWTDFNLYNDPATAELAAAHMINDFRVIRCESDRDRLTPLTPRQSAEMHAQSRGFIEAELSRPFSGETVIVTHHLPSARSVHARYGTDVLNACFASNLDALVERSDAALWIHGHTHTSCDYTIGRTRIVCNPRGYVGHELNPDFDPDLVVEV